MSKTAEAKLRVIIAGIVLVLTIVALFTINGTLAWFSENENVSAKGMQVQVIAPDQIAATLSSYGVLTMETVDGTVYYHYDTSEELYDLPTDDPAGIGYDKYLKALVVCITVNVTKEEKLALSVRSGSSISVENDNFFSNVTSYAVAARTNATDNTVSKTQESRSFVTVPSGGGDPTRVQNISLTSEITVTPQMNEIYVIIEYNDSFIDYINGALMDRENKTVNYSHDITFTVGVM